MPKFLKKVGVAGLVAVGLVVGSASAAMAADVSVKWGKTADGPFKTTLETKLKKGDARNYFIQVKSRTGDDEGADLRQGANPYYLNSYYFLKNGTEITDQVKNGNRYEFIVKGDKPKIFRLRARHTTGGPLGACLQVISEDEAAAAVDALLGFSVDPDTCL